MSDPAASPAPARPTPSSSRRSAVVVPHQASFKGRLLARALYGAIRAVDATIRYRLEDPADTLHRIVLAGPVIFAIWHNRLALSLMLYRRYVLGAQRERRMAAMVSASRDGGLLAHALKMFRVKPVRGSSSRRGPQALLEMQRLAEQGWDLAITPDGPRGPCYSVQPGVISVAAVTGMTIVPVCFDVSWKRSLRSWDRFQIPCPFARVTIRVAPVMQIPRHPDEAEHAALRETLEARLRAITRD